jgi:hypothetical protein
VVRSAKAKIEVRMGLSRRDAHEDRNLAFWEARPPEMKKPQVCEDLRAEKTKMAARQLFPRRADNPNMIVAVGEDEDRGRLAAALASKDQDAARFVADASVTLEQLPAPFLARTRLFEAERFQPTRPTLLYAALADDGAAFVLTANSSAFNAMFRHDGGRVDGPADAVELARAFLQVTRPQSRRYCVVTTVDEVPWRPGADVAAERRAVAEKLASPAATPIPTGWRIDLFVVDANSLDCVTVRVDRSGGVSATSQRLFDDLTLTYTL